MSCIKRVQNELVAAEAFFSLSELAEAKVLLKVPRDETFYSAVIGHAYYSIFYAAKAYVLYTGTKLPEQGQHKAVYSAFKRLVKQGKIDSALLELYDEVKVKAETLLEILEGEEKKRTTFTYKTHSQANKDPASDSIKNAQVFFSHLKGLIEKNPNRR
ncbi:HEPN domain-containing protein [Candidatus Pacearchaeota archaeon]|nr:HEPN domain-containing protein [Candidatus Pacearchaeota archaeon]